MRDVAFVVLQDFSMMALSLVMAFEVANSISPVPAYELHFVSEHGGRIRISCGMMLETEKFTDRPFHTLVVGGAPAPEPSTPGLLAFMRNALRRHRRVAAISTGAFVLAEAGLLDGRRATTHWAHAALLEARFPAIEGEQDCIFTEDDPVWTAAGGAACLDLGLALIERDGGASLARTVARELVVYHRRSGVQPQISALLELAPKSDRIGAALTYARDNLHKPLTVPGLAEAARLSPRQFSRAFRAETGQSPAKAIETLRIEGARTLMEQSRHPIDVVARETGFSDRDHMRRAFVRAYGAPPQALRRNARLGAGVEAPTTKRGLKRRVFDIPDATRHA